MRNKYIHKQVETGGGRKAATGAAAALPIVTAAYREDQFAFLNRIVPRVDSLMDGDRVKRLLASLLARQLCIPSVTGEGAL